MRAASALVDGSGEPTAVPSARARAGAIVPITGVEAKRTPRASAQWA